MIGRYETSTNPIASGSLTLLRHSRRTPTLLGEPSLPKNQKLPKIGELVRIGELVKNEELLTYESPIARTARVAYQDSLLGAKPVPCDQPAEPVFKQPAEPVFKVDIRNGQRCPHPGPLDANRSSKIHLGSVYFCFAAPLGLSARPVRFEMQEEELPRSRYGLVQS